MIRTKYFYYTLLFTLNCVVVIAQQSVLLNQASFNSYLLNQAAVGLSADPAVNCHYKKNWLGFAESPEITQVTFDGAFNKKKSGGGVTLLNEKAGISSKTMFSGAYRHRFRLTKTAELSFGISGGFTRQLSDFSKLKAESPEEFALWPSQQAVTIPDAGAGVLVKVNEFLIGASANHILNQNFVFKEPVFNNEVLVSQLSNYVIYAKKLFQVSTDWGVMGNIILRTTQGLPVQPDASATVIYKNKITLTGGWRPTFAAYTGLGLKISERFTVRYFYEYSRLINGISLGGHELGIRFDVGNGKNKERSESRESNDDGLAEKIEKYEQDVNAIMKKVDSLDKNVNQLKSEVERLRNQQLSREEITRAIDQYFENGKSPVPANKQIINSATNSTASANYRIIKYSDNDSQTFDTITGNYRVVYGVYQLLNYAKEFQKLVKREAGFETVLVEIPGHPKKYLYVCDAKEHAFLKAALKQLRETDLQLSRNKLEITKGKPWILQLSKD